MEYLPEDIDSDYDLIDFWRENLPSGEYVKMPRMIIGKPCDYVLGLSEEAVFFDAIVISKRHLDSMTNKEIIDFIQAQSHTIN